MRQCMAQILNQLYGGQSNLLGTTVARDHAGARPSGAGLTVR